MGSMTIGKKLFLSLGAALALTLAVSCLALWGVNTLNADLNKVVKVEALKRYLASDMNTIMSDFMAEDRGILVGTLLKDKR